METRVENVFSSEEDAEAFIQNILQKTNFEDIDEARRFIEAIYCCQNQGKRLLRTSAQTLESNIRTVFNSSHKYIYELLQNADDVGATEVEMNIQGETLLFSHSGSHFRPSDVEKICDNAQSRGNKAGEIDKTGYKGVGFKANFCISNKITVLSGHVCFRFDQDSFEQPMNYPWPIMPIWTNKDAFLSSLDPHKVHFYLERIDPIKVRREIEEIFFSPEVLLLLRHINCVTLHHLGLRVIRVKNEERITLEKIQNEISIYKQQYSIHRYPIDIPVDQKEYLSRLPPSECPEKLKTAETVTITFAVQLNSHGLPIVAKQARLYAYLPTDILSGLPFWVNTEFLLKQDRGQLLDNGWNKYLMYEIGKLQFTVLRQIAENPATKNRVLKLLPPHELSNHQLAYFKEAYLSGFERGFNTIAFIPSISNTLLRRDECIIDEHQFFNSVQGGFTQSQDTQAVFSDLYNADSALITEPLLGSPETLKTMLRLPPEKVFSSQDLVAKLAQYMAVISQNNTAMRKLWSYLMNADGELLKTLKERPWLLLKSGKLQIPAKCFLPIDSHLDPDLSELEIIDEHILPSAMRTTITHWFLQHLSVGQFTWHDVIKIHYPKLISEHKVDKPRAIRMLWQIYTAYQNKDISEEMLKQLGSIFPIEIGMTITPMNQCMMPMILVENGTSTENFLERISNDYFPRSYPYDFTVLRGLLITMGVRTELTFIYYPKVRIEDINRSTRLNEYVTYCQNQYRQITNLFTTKSHQVEHFFDCDFIEKISSPGYKEIFWRLLVENFAFILQTTYVAPQQGRLAIVSPILFYLKNKAYLKAKNSNQFYYSYQLYVASFFSSTEEFSLPVADIPEDIPVEILHALGFKTQLTFEDAMSLLEDKNHRKSPKMLSLIYRGILRSYAKTSTQHNERIQTFLENKTLLSTQGVLKKCDKLFWLDLHEEPHTETYFFIDPCGLSFDEMRGLAQILKLKSFSRESLDTLSTVSLGEPHQGEKICKELKLKVLDFLHIATIHVLKQNGDQTAALEVIAEKFYQKLLTLKLTCCDDLCFEFQQMMVSEDEFEKDKVVIKEHDFELLFTKQAFDNESSSLIDAFAKMMFESEELKKTFSDYMNKPVRIRQQELAIKKRYSDEALAQAKQFFVARRTQLLSTQPSLSHIKISSCVIEQNSTQQQPIYSSGGHLHTLWNASRPSTAMGANTAKTSTRSTKEIEKTVQNIQTGYQGEEKFYAYLCEQTKKLFPDAVIVETPTGYVASNPHSQVFLKVTWFNKESEQRKAMDFEVEYLGQRYIFEIKTTLGTEMHAFISSSELKQLQEHKGNYALVFVFGNGDIHVRWNPAQKISDNILRLIPMQYQIELNQYDDLAWGTEEYHSDKGCMMS